MRKYELMTIYPLEEDKYKAGLENVKNVLSQFGVTSIILLADTLLPKRLYHIILFRAQKGLIIKPVCKKTQKRTFRTS